VVNRYNILKFSGEMNMSNVYLRSFLVKGLLIIAVILTNSSYAIENPTNTRDKTVEVSVGIYAPFANKKAFIGRNMLAAMEMGSEQFSSPHLHYSFYTLNELDNSSDASATLQKFIKAHHIKVLLTEGSNNGALAAPLAKENNIIHFSMASDPAIADGTNNFLAWSPAAEQAEVLVRELKQRNVHQLGIITANTTSDRVLTQSVMKQLQKNSAIKIVVNEQFNLGTKNFSSLMNKIKGKNPDLYLIMAAPKHIELLQSAMSTAHVDKPITTIVERVTPKVMNIFNGQWYVDTHEMKPEFIKQFKANYINYPVTEAGYAFDVFQILNQSILMVMKTNTGFSTQAISRQIHSLSIDHGVMGPLNLDEHGVLYTQSEVKQIKNGQVLTA
jgi:branched-chain amino acid transport system substrate-binding protein